MATSSKKIRYALVGLGHIAQEAVLPAFANAGKNSELVAFVSDDPIKHQKLGKKYRVENHFSYEQYDDCLNSGEIDAVYIALPNHLHREFTVRAAKAGIHVLCEKPLAVTARDCSDMIRTCEKNGVKLMTAYRLHFEKTNLQAAQIVQSGKIGEPQIFNSLFSFQVQEENIRTKKETGGGTLYDIGVYCINAARYLFRDEPTEVFATSIRNLDKRSREVDAITTAILKFPKNRVASFTTSFALADIATYTVLGTKGSLSVDMAYEYSGEMEMELTVDGKSKKRTTAKRDQFGAELVYFSNCILQNKNPEPSGKEGLIDVQIVEALYKSARTGKPVKLTAAEKKRRPTMRQEIHLRAVKKPELVHAKPPFKE